MAVSGNRIGELTVEERYWRIALCAVFLVTVARLFWLALGQADLYPDEAQYWLWSLHPAFGYYSKPPLVAWLIAATTALFGDNELGVRIAAPLLHFGTALVLFGWRGGSTMRAVALWSAVVYATLPGVSASAMIMSTDAPLLLCWTVALYAFVRAREAGGGRWWIAGGAARRVRPPRQIRDGLLADLGAALPLRLPRRAAASAALLRGRGARPRHLRAQFLLELGAWLRQLSPHRDNADLGGPLFHPGHFLEFFGSQFGVFGPVLFAALIVIVALARRSLGERRAALLACFALPTLAMMLVVSVLSRAQPNWAAPTYVSAMVLVVAWLLGQGRARLVAAGRARHRDRADRLHGARCGAALRRVLPAQYDPLHRLRGWKPPRRTVGGCSPAIPARLLMTDDRE